MVSKLILYLASSETETTPIYYKQEQNSKSTLTTNPGQKRKNPEPKQPETPEEKQARLQGHKRTATDRIEQP